MPSSVNTVVAVVDDGISFAGTALTFDPLELGFGAEFDEELLSAEVDSASGSHYMQRWLGISFVPGSTESAISALLAAERLVPCGKYQDFEEPEAPLSIPPQDEIHPPAAKVAKAIEDDDGRIGLMGTVHRPSPDLRTGASLNDAGSSHPRTACPVRQ